MKKLFWSLLLFVLVLHTADAQENSGVWLLTPGLRRAEVEQKIGKSIQESRRDGLVIWWYNAADPVDADFAYFKDDTLVMTSEHLSQNNQTLDQYIRKHGLPQKSVYKFGDGETDPVQMTVHIWSEKGLAVQTSGTAAVSPVVRNFNFTPTSLENFMQDLAPDLGGHQEVSISGLSMPSSIQAIDVQKLFSQAQTYTIANPAIVAIGTLIFLLLVVFMFNRKKKKTSP